MPNQALIASDSAKAKAEARILRLIGEYQRLANEAVEAMKQAYGRSNLLRAWRSGKIKKSGMLTKGRISYDFHGAGCRFEFGKHTVDVDFGPNERHDGFDAWRLWLLADSNPAYSDLDRSKVERALATLQAKGIIKKLEGGTSDHLYYLTKSNAGAE